MNISINKIDTNVGICTICQEVHVTTTTFEEDRICESCGERSIYSIIELCDLANAYLSFCIHTVYE